MRLKKSIAFLKAIIAIQIFIFTPVSAWCRDLRASMAFLPKLLETPDKGMFVDLVKAIDDEYKEGIIIRKVYPFPRSLKNVIYGYADFHIPLFRNTILPPEQLPYAFTTAELGKVVIVIYSHKEKRITAQMIRDAIGIEPFPYHIETINGLETSFDFPLKTVNKIDSAMKKLSRHRIDAFIWAQEEADFTLKQLELKTIHREHYRDFDDVLVIPKGPEGKEIDRILSTAIEKLRKSGRLKELHSKVHVPYQDWQPYE